MSVRSHDEAIADIQKALRSGAAEDGAHQLATPEMLWNVLTANRWRLLTALMKAGEVKREAESVVFPFETIKVEYELKATG